MKKTILCNKCNKRAAVASAVMGGVYYKDVCLSCMNEAAAFSSGSARWERTIDAEDHEADLQQPYNADGTINTRFAKMYPKQAQALFTPEQLDRETRK